MKRAAALLVLLASTALHAEVTDPEAPAAGYTWYGWQPLLGDAAASPMIHAAHGHEPRGIGSLALRVAAPLGGLLLGSAIATHMDQNCSHEDLCGLGGALLGGLVGTLTAIVLDDGVLSWDEKPTRPGFAQRLAPSVPSRETRVFWRSAGRSSQSARTLAGGIGSTITRSWKLGAEAQKRIAAATPGELGNKLSKVVDDTQALAKDPANARQRCQRKSLGQHDPAHSADCGWSSSRAQETIDTRRVLRAPFFKSGVPDPFRRYEARS